MTAVCDCTCSEKRTRTLFHSMLKADDDLTVVMVQGLVSLHRPRRIPVESIQIHTRCELPQPLCLYRPIFRASGWGAGWQDPFKHRSLPLSGISCRLFCPADIVALLLKCGLWAQLILMATSPLFSLFLCEWLLWNSSPSLCHFALCMPCATLGCKVNPSLQKSLLRHFWTKFQF